MRQGHHSDETSKRRWAPKTKKGWQGGSCHPDEVGMAPDRDEAARGHPSRGDKEAVPTSGIIRWMGSIGGTRRVNSVMGDIARKVYNHVLCPSKRVDHHPLYTIITSITSTPSTLVFSQCSCNQVDCFHCSMCVVSPLTDIRRQFIANQWSR